MEVQAKHRFLRMSSRKVRLLLPELKGASVDDALARLRLARQGAALPLSKVIKSAAANAEHNYSLDRRTLVVSAAYADEGPVLKRYKPRARGRADQMQRPSTHITVILKDIPVPKERLVGKAAAAAKKVVPKRAKKDDKAPAKSTAKSEEQKQPAPVKDVTKSPDVPQSPQTDERGSADAKNKGGDATMHRRTAQGTGRDNASRSSKGGSK